MFVVKLRPPSRANYEHFHVYLAYRRQTGTVVTRQTYDRAPHLTRPPTAHISRGDHTIQVYSVMVMTHVIALERANLAREHYSILQRH